MDLHSRAAGITQGVSSLVDKIRPTVAVLEFMTEGTRRVQGEPKTDTPAIAELNVIPVTGDIGRSQVPVRVRVRKTKVRRSATDPYVARLGTKCRRRNDDENDQDSC